MKRAPRTDYTVQDTRRLAEYIAVENPTESGRSGNNLYKNLVDNLEKWPWAARHPWQSWREHYKKNQEEIDPYIRKYQRRSNVKTSSKKPKLSTLRQISVEEAERSVKDKGKQPARTRVDGEEDGDGQTRAGKKQVAVRRKALVESRTEREDTRPADKAATSNENNVKPSVTKLKSSTFRENIVEEGERAVKGKGKQSARDRVNEEEDEQTCAGKKQVAVRPKALVESRTEQGDMRHVDKAATNNDERGPQQVDEIKILRRDHPRKEVDHQPDLASEAEADPSQQDADPRNPPDEPDCHVAPTEQVVVPPPSEDYSGNVFDEPTDSKESESSENRGEEADVTVLLDDPSSTGEDREPDKPASSIPQPESTLRRVGLDRRSTSPSYNRVYPDLATAPSPTLGSKHKLASLAMPGMFTEPISQRPPTRNASVQSPGIQQEPTPPVSVPASIAGSDVSLPFTPSLRRPPDVNSGAALVEQSTPVFRRRPRSRTPPILPYSYEDEDAREDKNIFESITPTPATRGSITRGPHREPPRLTEGPYTSAFTDERGRSRFSRNGRRASGVDEDAEENWPPARGASFRKSGAGKVDKEKGDAKEVDEIPNAQHPFSQVSSREEDHRPRRRGGVHRYAEQIVAAASKIPSASTGQPGHHPFSQTYETLNTRSSMAEAGASLSKPSNLEATTPKRIVQRFLTSISGSAPTFTSTVSADAAAGPLDLRHSDSAAGQSLRTSEDRISTREVSLSRGATAGSSRSRTPWPPSANRLQAEEMDGRAVHASPPESISTLRWTSKEDYSRNDRRKTFPGFVLRREDVGSTSINHIPEERRTRSSMPGSYSAPFGYAPRSASVATTVQFSTPSPPSPERPSDQRLAMQLGTNYLLDAMAQNHGFQKEVVYGVFENVKDFQKADEILKDMREAAERIAMKKLSGHDTSGSDAASTPDSEEISSYEDCPGLAVRSDGEEHDRSRNTSSISLGRTSALRRVPANDEQNEYRPPRDSRAGEYARLAKAGREEEARRRERRRSTLGGGLPRKARRLNETDTAVSRRERTPENEPLEALAQLMAMSPRKSPPKTSHSLNLGDRDKPEVARVLAGDKTIMQDVEGLIGKGQARKLTAALYSAYL
ncbi:hypothetical protein NEOLEDRAFT_1142769 [Neolentinus lepideus HHB14362 ss-1]|uniref:TERF2-interacting telomeric protein 1 Myb domain-containing protein n=1 Tax=Neolentinus lepideus HHB14362 ss-1 TaxID=1314782 RepID=A0A165MXK6_9AGAM|nr:hypothetical protein NEOLEDRAFT_1142769 [Neolentinus lepideus HHB14362 ss-1]